MSYIGSKPTAVPLTGADIEDGTVQIADLAATGTKDATTFLRGDGTFASAGESNTPNFYAYGISNQTINDATDTKIQFDTEVVDSDSAYDTSTYRFTVPSGKGGLYFFNTTYRILGGAVSEVNIQYRKNGSAISSFYLYSGNVTNGIFSNINYLPRHLTLLQNLSAGDYIEVFAYANLTAGSTTDIQSQQNVGEFSGFRISS